jgi:tRNA pseudouridine55 synthase
VARRNKKGRPINGIIVIDKPTGRSSNHVLQQVKRLFNAQKAGHTGSLDPLATGLLPVCLGDATRISSYLLDADKSYRVECQLGVVTDSGDSDGNVIAESPVPEIEQVQIETIIEGFVGEQDQVPPMYSALKHQGQPLYKLARQGIEIERKARRVTIYDIKLVSLTSDTLCFDVSCSKGTYIRSLIEDIGQQIGCGAHVTMLRRTSVAGYNESQSITIDDLVTLSEQGLDSLDELLLPPEQALADWPKLSLTAEQTEAVLHGQQLSLALEQVGQLLCLFNEQQQFIGIAEVIEGGVLAPKRIFQSQQQQLLLQ